MKRFRRNALKINGTDMENIDIYLSGQKLYGDDFDLHEIELWYKDEQEGYADLIAENNSSYKYAYHALNIRHGFRYIEKRNYKNALGLGSAFGDEFLPIIDRIEKLTIVEPSEIFAENNVHGVPCNYIKPSIDGLMPFENSTFDIILSLGVLHHIPNVTSVVRELFRCLSDNGMVLMREPIISMGNWSGSRPGLTENERGIPLNIFHDIINNAGFIIKHESLCIFPLIPKIYNLLGMLAYNSSIATWIDEKLSNLFSWKIHYHSTKFIHKFRPTSIYFVLGK